MPPVLSPTRSVEVVTGVMTGTGVSGVVDVVVALLARSCRLFSSRANHCLIVSRRVLFGLKSFLSIGSWKQTGHFVDKEVLPMK